MSSAAPVRAPGTRTRSGNAMQRTRTAILDAAQRCVEKHGVRKTTMSDVASTGGVAKATLYNHFRTKDDVLDALVAARVAELGARCVAVAGGAAEAVPGQPDPGRGLADALRLAAAELAAAPALRRVAVEEPALLARVAVPGGGAGWDEARACARQALAADGLPTTDLAVDLVLRHLVAALVWPSTGEDGDVAAEVLARGLRAMRPAGQHDPAPGVAPQPAPSAHAVVDLDGASPPPAPPVPVAAGAALGWPG